MSALSFHHLIDAKQIQKSDLEKLFALAEKYRSTPAKKILEEGDCRGYILAALFLNQALVPDFHLNPQCSD